ncbi:hypothetical protein HY625_01225 [Candidatus Uhrbacteria bacterium]|nr:hypothetical protein [Candidatus Uhrbacteria bacterium]
MLEGRKAALLEAVITEHIKTAEPVGSKFLVGKYGIAVSPATVRNDMVTLEEEGYLTHPHTSAGRVPTAKGYRYYADHCISDKLLTKKKRAVIEQRCAKAPEDDRQLVKELAKVIAEVAHEAILVGFDRDDVYYTGLSYLLAQPEFSESDVAVTVSQVLDRLDETMRELIMVADTEYTVAIGEENPFGHDTSVVVVRYGKSPDSFFGILGPTRMDYAENIALAKYAREIMIKYSHD